MRAIRIAMATAQAPAAQPFESFKRLIDEELKKMG